MFPDFLGAPRRTNSSSTRFSRGGTIDHEDDEDGEDGFPSLHDPAIRSLLQALEGADGCIFQKANI